MALIADMGELDILVFEMIRHDNGFNDFFTPCHNLAVMASQAQGGDLLFLFNRQCSDLFIVLNVICISAVTKLTGYGFVFPVFMNFCFIGMAFETRRIGSVPDRNQDGFGNGIRPVGAVNPKGMGKQ